MFSAKTALRWYCIFIFYLKQKEYISWYNNDFQKLCTLSSDNKNVPECWKENWDFEKRNELSSRQILKFRVKVCVRIQRDDPFITCYWVPRKDRHRADEFSEG